MSKIFKRILSFFLVVFAFATVPPISFLIVSALALADKETWKSRFSQRARLRAERATPPAGFFNRLYVSFRKKVWPHLRSSKQTMWAYYSRPRTLLMLLGCVIANLWAIYLWLALVQENTTSDYLSYSLKQVAITGFLAVSLCALAWVLFSIEFAFRSVFVTLVLSAIVSALVVYARLLAIDFLSEVFPFPPTYMPIAFSIAIILLAASFTSIVFGLLALAFEFYCILALGSNFKRSVLISSTLVFASAVGLYNGWFGMFAMFAAGDPRGQLLIVKLAEKYDFTSNHMCDTGLDEKVLFIDNVPDRAIAATFPKVGQISPKDLVKNGIQKYMPRGFHTVRCNPLEPLVDPAGWCNEKSRFGYCRSK